MTLTATRTRISLEFGCSPACDEFAGPLYLQMSGGKYDECAVLRIPAWIGTWWADHRTARTRAGRATARGYTFDFIKRHERAAEIHAINTSTPERQGRPMSSGYHQWPTETALPDYDCTRHAVRTYGIEDKTGTLVAYCVIYRAGQLVLVSQILGHADHLKNEIMYLLIAWVISLERRRGPWEFLVYNRYDSGTDGLRFFKDRCGFEPTRVEWLP